MGMQFNSQWQQKTWKIFCRVKYQYVFRPHCWLSLPGYLCISIHKVEYIRMKENIQFYIEARFEWDALSTSTSTNCLQLARAEFCFFKKKDANWCIEIFSLKLAINWYFWIWERKWTLIGKYMVENPKGNSDWGHRYKRYARKRWPLAVQGRWGYS